MKILEGTVASVPPQGGRKHPHQDFLQIDTKNILFICGGAFGGLEENIRQRIGKKSIGFGSDVDSRLKEESDDILQHVQPEDLLKYGLIPEFVGRLPVISTLRTPGAGGPGPHPHRAEERPGAGSTGSSSATTRWISPSPTRRLSAVAELALERGTGARGLRSILETALLPTMYELPSRSDVKGCVVDADTVQRWRPALPRDQARSKYSYDEEETA